MGPGILVIAGLAHTAGLSGTMADAKRILEVNLGAAPTR